MARYCRTDDCPRSEHPLPKGGGSCPDCGSVRHRLDPDVGVMNCRLCGKPNESSTDVCWSCGAEFDASRTIGSSF